MEWLGVSAGQASRQYVGSDGRRDDLLELDRQIGGNGTCSVRSQSVRCVAKCGVGSV